MCVLRITIALHPLSVLSTHQQLESGPWWMTWKRVKQRAGTSVPGKLDYTVHLLIEGEPSLEHADQDVLQGSPELLPGGIWPARGN